MLSALTTALLVLSLVHVFLFVYSRHLLCLADGHWKLPVHVAWFGLSVVLPVVLLVTFRDHPALGDALAWRPRNDLSLLLFGGIAGVVAFAAARTTLWALERFFPERPGNLLEETVHDAPVPSVPPALPRAFRRFETTGDLQLVERELAVSGLAAAFDGLTIAQVSDVHFGQRLEMENYLEGVRQLVQHLAPDVVVLTGDFVDKRRDIARSIEYHAQFRGTLGTFCVLGNHDYWTNARRVRDALAMTPIRWVGGGERRVLRREGRRLVLTGTDAPWNGERPDWRRLVRRETGDAVILLSHTPDNAPAAARAGASLILSGHNHGGQVCLPLIGPVIVPSEYGVRYAGGLYRVGRDSLLNVSNGIGVSSGGMRVLCPPQVCLLTLRAPVVEVMAGRVVPRSSLFAPAAPPAEADFSTG